MQVGDRVKSTSEWNAKYWPKGMKGTLISIGARGPITPERTHNVDLDEPIGQWHRLWFDPNDLELE